jgi:hypothetical protein
LPWIQETIKQKEDHDSLPPNYWRNKNRPSTTTTQTTTTTARLFRNRMSQGDKKAKNKAASL